MTKAEKKKAVEKLALAIFTQAVAIEVRQFANDSLDAYDKEIEGWYGREKETLCDMAHEISAASLIVANEYFDEEPEDDE